MAGSPARPDNPLRAGRYHSLVADPELPADLELSASLGDVVMGVRLRAPGEGAVSPRVRPDAQGRTSSGTLG
jgi:hypothetical protein